MRITWAQLAEQEPSTRARETGFSRTSTNTVVSRPHTHERNDSEALEASLALEPSTHAREKHSLTRGNAISSRTDGQTITRLR